MSDSGKTHFGFREVDTDDKSRLVGDVFHSVARRYDLMNDLLSGGVHRLWKRFAIELTGLRPGQRVLDLAGGTGDLAALMAKRVGNTGSITLADINDSMLGVGRDRLTDRGLTGNLHFVQADAEALPFPEAHFDCVTIAFGLRNVTRKENALAEMQRVLKPGGRVLVLEFSKPRSPLLASLYDHYSFKIMPKIGEWVANDGESYRYLAESIRMHPDQDSLKTLMEAAGFERCTYYNLTGGVVAAHLGFKP